MPCARLLSLGYLDPISIPLHHGCACIASVWAQGIIRMPPAPHLSLILRPKSNVCNCPPSIESAFQSFFLIDILFMVSYFSYRIIFCNICTTRAYVDITIGDDHNFRENIHALEGLQPSSVTLMKQIYMAGGAVQIRFSSVSYTPGKCPFQSWD